MIYLFWLGNGATSEVGKYFFRVANMWWMCAQYFVIKFVARCLETIYVCIWYMFGFMSVVVTVWRSVVGDLQKEPARWRSML